MNGWSRMECNAKGMNVTDCLSDSIPSVARILSVLYLRDS